MLYSKLIISLAICSLLPLMMVSEAFAKKIPRKSKEELKLMERRRLDALVFNLGAYNYVPFENAVRDFEEMGEEGVPLLVEILHNEGKKVRVHKNAIYTLGRLGPLGRRGVSAIIPFLRTGDADMRAVGAIALGKIGKSAREGVPALVQLLFDSDSWVVKSSRAALKRIGTAQALKAVKEYDDLQTRVGKDEE